MKRLVSVAVCLSALMVSGCSGDSAAQDTPGSNGEDTSLTVFAAASLQGPFDEIGDAFMAEHPDVTVEFNYAGSSTLAQNLVAGAPADVFASADEVTMDAARQADLLAGKGSELFAVNYLVGIVPKDNPAGIQSLADATAPEVNLVVCAPQVPCGALSQTVAQASNLSLEPVSEEQQVTDVLGKVRSGQADAGLVYATEAALAADEVDTFELDDTQESLNYYPIAPLATAQQPELAEEFIDFVQAETGQDILQAHGFQAP
jgi:molybdate transport system substrate-binding protein